jgi:hypothetical protein
MVGIFGIGGPTKRLTFSKTSSSAAQPSNFFACIVTQLSAKSTKLLGKL